MQQSGGLLLIAGLDGDDTMISAIGGNEASHVTSSKKAASQMRCSLFALKSDSNHEMQQSGGLLLIAGLDGDDTMISAIGGNKTSHVTSSKRAAS